VTKKKYSSIVNNQVAVVEDEAVAEMEATLTDEAMVSEGPFTHWR
jgi:hypothetical protein